LHCNDNARYTCRDECLGAWWRAPEVIARLERDVHRGIACRLAGSTKRLYLGMCLTDWLGEATEALAIGGNENCSDPWVGSARQSRRSGDTHRLAHRLLVDVVHLFLLPSGL
jgi:hypothetical protein